MRSPRLVDPNREYCLGMNLLGHDGSLSVLDLEGLPVMVLEDERYRRVKRGEFVVSPSLIEHVWSETGIRPEQIKVLAVANIQALRELRETASRGHSPWHGYDRLVSQMLQYYVAQLPSLDAVVQVRHHLAHAASAYYPSGYRNAAILTVDAKGETESATVCVGDGGTIHTLARVPLPTSLGYLYEQSATWAGLRGAERAGKLMALSAYGDESLIPVLQEALFASVTGPGFRLSPELLNRPSTRPEWATYLAAVLGPPRSPDAPLTHREHNVASALQRITEQVVISLAREAHRLTGLEHLCLAGGVFANSLANGRILREGPFHSVYVPPWPNDAGLSIGAALYAIGSRCHSAPPQKWNGAAFLGAQADSDEIEKVLSTWKLPVERLQAMPARIAADLVCQGLVVGWYQGPAEVGPRALGARSILALPRDSRMADHINTHVKFREVWRPYAPAVLDCEVARLFGRSYESPYMSFAHPVTDYGKHALAATLAADNTARLQVVTPEDGSPLYQLLVFLKELTGIGAVLNTSFNVQGEPIVRTPAEAVRTFLACGIDVLVIDHYVVYKAKVSQRSDTIPSPRINYPSFISEALKRQLDGKSCVLLWMDSRIRSEQTAFLETLCRRVTSVPLPREWAACPEKARACLDGFAASYDFIVLGSTGYLPFTVSHLQNVLRPFLAHAAADRCLVVDRDLRISGLEPMLMHSNGPGYCGEEGELEFVWANQRGED